MITIYAHRDGVTKVVDRVEREWLDPSSPVTMWVDLTAPTDDEVRILSEVFGFHPLSVEDARSALQYPKIEPYPGYLYLVLHGIDVTRGRTQFATQDVDFFLGHNYLVTVHDGQSRSIGRMRELCDRLKVPTEHRQLAEAVCREHLNVHRFGELRASTVVELLSRCDGFRKPGRIAQIALVCEADKRGRAGLDE